MATQPDFADDFDEDAPDLNLDDEDQDDQQDDAGDGDDQQHDGEPEEVDVVGWGEQPIAAEDEPEGLRNLRQAYRESEKRRKELEARLAPQQEEIGEKPQFDDYFDKPDEFEKDLLAWNDRQRAATERQTAQQQAAAKQQERWQAQYRDFEASYADLRVPGKDAALAMLEDEFPGEQKAFLIKAAGKNAPALVNALYGNEAKRKELKALADDGSYAEFIAAAAIMATEIKVTRKPAVGAETNHSAAGTSGGTGRGDQRRARLEAEAEKTGDYSALVRYEAQLGKK